MRIPRAERMPRIALFFSDDGADAYAFGLGLTFAWSEINNTYCKSPSYNSVTNENFTNDCQIANLLFNRCLHII